MIELKKISVRLHLFCVLVCAHMYADQCMACGSWFSPFYDVDPGDPTQVVRLGDRSLYLLSLYLKKKNQLMLDFSEDAIYTVENVPVSILLYLAAF